MASLSKDEIFQLMTINVKSGYNKHRKQLLRQLNRCLANNDLPAVNSLTISFALMFSTWAEAQFMQVLHTPNFLQDNDIQDAIKKNIENRWTHLLDKGFERVQEDQSIKDARKAEIATIIKKHTVEASLIRNKLAHGQFQIALNTRWTNKNEADCTKIARLDFVKVDYLFKIQQVIGFLVRDLAQSPDNSHLRFFEQHKDRLSNLEHEMAQRSHTTKKGVLKVPPRTK